MIKVLVTGANGFLGQGILSESGQNSFIYRGAVRKGSEKATKTQHDIVSVGDIGPDTNWANALEGVDVVIHTAAKVHDMAQKGTDVLSSYRLVNVSGTLNLARQAASAGVKRIIFISSIKVNGEETVDGKPFHADDHANPSDPYGISKLEAELGLAEIARKTGLEYVIIRPPLVYGYGVKANFAMLKKLASMSIPLPLGAIQNKRSMVSLRNLVSLITKCVDHPRAPGQVFLVSDGSDLSTSDLLQCLACAAGKKSFLIPMPAFILNFVACLIGRRQIASRVLGSLQVDISETCRVLDWVPPETVNEGIASCFRQSAH